MSLAVNVLCRNYKDDRVIPRFARYLADHLGWALTAYPLKEADIYYLSAYFEHHLLGTWDKPVASYFTHLETSPPGNAKAKLYHNIAKRVDLRIATAAMYAKDLADYGPTAQITPPVERERFLIPKQTNKKMVCGFSGYTYSNKRKGEDLVASVVNSSAGRKVAWKASGRGWPVPTKRYPWSEMPAFYQSLDVLVITSRVEGVPMPPLEALSCGVSVVIPQKVGLLDELGDAPGVHRYKAGNVKDLNRAFKEALEMRSSVDRYQLREITNPYTITTWCEQHRQAFEERFLWSEAYSVLPSEILQDAALSV